MKKLLSLASILKIRKKAISQGKTVVFTNGCFDLLHRGHIEYLSKAKKLGDILIVGLNSDSSVRKIKGKSRPLMAQKDRATILSALECIDYIVIFNEKTPLRLISILKPDILVKGADYRKYEIVGKEIVEARGGKVIRIPFIKGYSTTSFLERIRKLSKIN